MNKLFEPIKIGKHHLQHRVVLPPLTRVRASPGAIPNELMVEYYKQRASNGGLLITEATAIDRLAGGYPGAPGIYSKEHIDGWKKVTEAVHQKSGIIFLQLWHLGRASYAKLNPNNEPVVSASAIAIKGIGMLGEPYEIPRALEVGEIKEIVQKYKQAAKNAIEAGFDGVEIHGATGYLLDQFINSNSNQRTDEYGGSIENRARFPLEVVDAVVDAVGADRTAIRFSPGSLFHDMADENPIETWGYLTRSLQEKHSQLAYLHFIEPRSDMASGVSKIDSLEHFRKLWKGPFISAGGFSSSIENAFKTAEETGNLIAFGRQFVSNPDLPERIKKDLPLNSYDRDTFYTNSAAGYTDYPFYEEANR